MSTLDVTESINSRGWWEEYFRVNWDQNDGRAQTRHFMQCLVRHLPESEKQYLSTSAPTVLDWGCAFGDGVGVLAAAFPRCRVAGLDFAQTAIEGARSAFPKQEFLHADDGCPDRDFDVVVTSNCLEHFDRPLEVIESHLRFCRFLYIALVPYREAPLIDCHCSQFREECFPERLADFTRICAQPIDVDQDVWTGQQLLVVYASPSYLEARKSGEQCASHKEDNRQPLVPHQLLQATPPGMQTPHDRMTAALSDVLAVAANAEYRLQQSLKQFADREASTIRRLRQTQLELRRVHVEIATKDQRLAEKDQRLAERDGEVATLRAESQQLLGEKERLRCRLASIEDSRTWRLIGSLRHVRRGLLPASSTREQLARSVWRASRRFYRTIKSFRARKVLASVPTLDFAATADSVMGHAVVFASVPYDDIGGGQRSAQLARALLRRNYRVTYLHIYGRVDVKTGEAAESRVDHPRLDHRPLDAVSPVEVLSSVSEDATLVFEIPHRNFLPYLELATARGLRTIFELIDDWDSSLGAEWFDPEVMKEFIARCTVTVGTAQALVEKLTEAGAAHPQYLPNAADERIFDCYKSYERPTDYPRGFPRTLLYFGSLYGEWFAWDYLRAAAEQNRTTGFVLIGDNPGKVPMPSNVIFLGGKSNAELPAYLAAADAAMIPFAPCKITDAVSPIKVFEYLFLKKPVIATRMIELDGYPNVRQAESPAEFARLCGAVPKFDERAADEFISRNSWQSRLDQMIARDTLKRRFSFIILTHNNHRVLERCLRTLIENTRGIDSEIIVVDNCSTDGGDLMVEREFPQVRLLRNQRNGCSSGRNLGVAAATGDCLTFIDSDQWFTSAAWLYEADYILRHHPIVGAVGWAAGWLDVSRSPLGGDIVDYLPNRGVNVQGFRTDVAYLGTGGMFVPRRVWEQLDGFDEFYDPTCFEDTDLSFQIRRTGLLLAYRDLTGIRHQPHQTTQASGGSARYRELFARNSYYFKNKWQSHPQFFVADGQRRQAA